MNSRIDEYLEQEKTWNQEMTHLRRIALSTGLDETMKWGHPCYTLGKANVVLIHGFKEYCALLFFKGVLIDDSKNNLVPQSENVQATRQMRFTTIQEVVEQEDLIKANIYAAIDVEKVGKSVSFKKTSEFDLPEELKQKLSEDEELRAGFEALTPGRQRGYLLHIGQAKQSKTRLARIEKLKPKILEGKGWNER